MFMSLETKIKETISRLIDKGAKTRTQKITRREVALHKLHEALWIELIQEWQKQQQEHFPIPELITHEDVKETFGDAAFSGLGFSPDASHPLLALVFKDYGKLDERKCKVYLEKRDRDSRYTMSDVFFSYRDPEENSKILMNFMWNGFWKTLYAIPEMLVGRRIKEDIGTGVYRGVGVPTTDSVALLRKTIEGYGILTAEKCEFYYNARQKSIREGI